MAFLKYETKWASNWSGRLHSNGTFGQLRIIQTELEYGGSQTDGFRYLDMLGD